MSTDFHADLGYGFLLTDEKLLEDLNEGRIQLPKHLEMMWAGDAYSGEIETFIVIKGSLSQVVSWKSYSSFINKEELIATEEWDAQLLTWADENNIANAAVGWWLCTSLT